MESIERREPTPELWEQAKQKVGKLATEASYAYNFQPSYLDPEYLTEAVHELMTTQPVTQPEYVDQLQEELTKVATGESDRPVIITGNCSERVLLETPIHEMVRRSLIGIAVVDGSELEQPLQIRRERGQNTKPRSEETEVLPDGNIVMSYMGDAINDMSPHRREPDPSRLVAAGIQALDIENELTELLGEHVPAAHEALNLLYEEGFVRTNPANGKKYLLSADLPWIGVRTNDADSDHVELLSEIENPVGIKIGPDTDEAHVASLSKKLNPKGIPGKIVFMPRLGLSNTHKMPPLLEAIKKHEPEALILFDIHGSTKKMADGSKTREVDEIIEEIAELSQACKGAGLKLHGLHLETMADDSRLECIDDPSQKPEPGGIDPQLNPRQTRHILNSAAQYL